MKLQHCTRIIFIQLSDCLHQLSNEQYSSSLSTLSGNSIGKHVRHVLEFYGCLRSSLDLGVVDYDNRQRDLRIEEEVNAALQLMLSLQSSIEDMDVDQDLQMSFMLPNGQTEIMGTRLFRELVYNIEHAIHHMAIIKIAVLQHFPAVVLAADFGIAYSTTQYQEKCAQ